MTHFRIQTLPQNRFNDVMTGAFNAATIALVGVLGILTVAATI
jgi:hypothetical protein